MTKIALGGIWHETNTFAPDRTGLEGFQRYQFVHGEQILEVYKDTGTELGGALRVAEALDLKVAPLVFAAAVPSGIVTCGAFEEIADALLTRLRLSASPDGVLLVLHGAMCVDGHPDPEGELIARVRAVVGSVPIGVTLDLHANPSGALARDADLIVGYDTYPHVDMAERGAEAMELVHRMVHTGTRPETHLERLPLLTVPQMQDTREEPMRSLVEMLHALEQEPEVWTASLIPGFPYCDVDRLGFGVYVASDRDAAEPAGRLGASVWSQRAEFDAPELLDPEEAVREASAGPFPVVLADVADNVGGGSPGNGTVLLDALERRASHDGVIVLWDPTIVDEIYSSDADRMRITVARDSLTMLGPPVPVSGMVRRPGKMCYRRSGSYMHGQPVDMGRVAIVESAAGHVVLTENRVMPFDDDHLRLLGIDPEKQRIIVAKSATAWKAAFGRYAARVLFVRTPGACPGDLGQLAYSRRPHPLYPLERDATW